MARIFVGLWTEWIHGWGMESVGRLILVVLAVLVLATISSTYAGFRLREALDRKRTKKESLSGGPG